MNVVVIWHWEVPSLRWEGRLLTPEEAARERESLNMNFDLITSLSVFVPLIVLAALVLYCSCILRIKWIKKKRAER